jgi:hypothetical protein
MGLGRGAGAGPGAEGRLGGRPKTDAYAPGSVSDGTAGMRRERPSESVNSSQGGRKAMHRAKRAEAEARRGKAPGRPFPGINALRSYVNVGAKRSFRLRR